MHNPVLLTPLKAARAGSGRGRHWRIPRVSAEHMRRDLGVFGSHLDAAEVSQIEGIAA